jgi:hypothetical protein
MLSLLEKPRASGVVMAVAARSGEETSVDLSLGTALTYSRQNYGELLRHRKKQGFFAPGLEKRLYYSVSSFIHAFVA